MFYLFIIQNGDTTVSYKYNTFDEADSAFHTELAYRHENRTSTICLIIDNMGLVVKRDDYHKSE